MWRTLIGQPLNRSVKVLKCCRANRVGGADHGHLLAAHGDHEGAAQRHLRLSEPDIAADQRSMGLPAERSSSTSEMAASWSSVSP
jgi:hypothetical protein